ncbi:hypothetical protein BMJ26_24220 [Sinorhizobium medicae]|uniref:Uncharacterized protein n=1 Tax=Sinorhizobium medicae (strain WSM419) TaxID=366394 RepID=A6UK09_SINMW|nr:hypothetical protein Smed_5212 [Sinorhizobium medicae WSM419]PLU20847.1 hypothetical protein BMJ31_17595 [Sinorhizobium medicae]PLU25798.1 hypothetical protein BMJ28_32995 [Sinorhizobium medicae]PLU33324.1 hypothetical protein BMJ26_24220 [Sinorhizobium medicae]PLU52404.1 hypothetical protein BMJ24_28080 [Sinorhizobium medicae]
MSNQYRRIEVITGDVRRRWCTIEKLQIIKESFEVGERYRPPLVVMGLRPNKSRKGIGISRSNAPLWGAGLRH